MPIDPTYKIISVHASSLCKELFIMTGITEKQYHAIKHGDVIHITKGNLDADINPDDVLCFGTIDFHEGSEDSKQLDTFNWLEHLGAKGISIPSRYNYDRHECTSPKKIVLYTETWRNSTLCRYLHGCLGKPEYTLIYREIR